MENFAFAPGTRVSDMLKGAGESCRMECESPTRRTSGPV